VASRADGIALNGAFVFVARITDCLQSAGIIGGPEPQPMGVASVCATRLGAGAVVRSDCNRMGRWPRLIRYFRAPEEELVKVFGSDCWRNRVSRDAADFALDSRWRGSIARSAQYTRVQGVRVGLAAQEAGHAVTAAEDYAIVLGLNPSDNFARYNLGILQQDAGRVGEALALYTSALRTDPAFAPARLRIGTLLQAGGH
jgi:tetratricopeptide (TPR) repeat protein